MASELEPAAAAVLETGRLMMQAGANAASATSTAAKVAIGLGAREAHVRIGYASIGITLVSGETSLTRMIQSNVPGVDKELELAIWRLAERTAAGGLDAAQVMAELERLPGSIPRYGHLLISLAAGLAGAAFARLMDADWSATAAVLAASSIGQAIRSGLHQRGINGYIVTGVVAFAASLAAGWLARITGSFSLPAAMIASVLFLVPGVPALNAQNDILGGHPTLGSARAVGVFMTLVFISAGLWFAYAIVRAGQ